MFWPTSCAKRPHARNPGWQRRAVIASLHHLLSGDQWHATEICSSRFVRERSQQVVRGESVSLLHALDNGNYGMLSSCLFSTFPWVGFLPFPVSMTLLCVFSPEGLGMVSGAVFLIFSFLFIPLPFVESALAPSAYPFPKLHVSQPHSSEF